MKFDIETARDPSLSCAAAKVMILDAADELAAAHDLIREMRDALSVAGTRLLLPSDDVEQICAAIAKADTFLSGKQEEKAVRFGCHVERDHSVYNKNAPIFDDCDQSCTRPVEKEKCLHWREIKEPT